MENENYLNFCKDLESKGVDWLHWESEFEKHKKLMQSQQETEVSLTPSTEDVVVFVEEEQTTSKFQDILDSNIPCTQISVFTITLYCSLILCITLILFFLVGLPLIIEESLKEQNI